MHHIVEDIAQSRTVRIADIAGLNNEVGDIRSDTKKTLKNFNSTRKRDGSIMRRTLRNVVRDNRTAVLAIEQDTQDMLAGFDAQHQRVKKDLAEAHEIWRSHTPREHPGAGSGLKTMHKNTAGPQKKQKNTDRMRARTLKKKSANR